MSRLGTKRVSSPPAPLAAPPPEGRRWFRVVQEQAPERGLLAKFRSTGDASLMEKATPAWMAAARASDNDLRPEESIYVRRPASMARDAGSFLKRFADACLEPLRFAHVELAVDRDDGFAVDQNFDVQQLRRPRLATVSHVTLRHSPPLPVAPLGKQ
jgi:hypothetical protein